MNLLFRKYGHLLFAGLGYMFIYIAYANPEKETPAIVISLLQFGCAMLVRNLYGEPADREADRE